MTPEQLAATIEVALRALRAADSQPGDAHEPHEAHRPVEAYEPDEPHGCLRSAVVVRRPARREHGDWATAIALQLAPRVGRTPRDLADQLAERLSALPGIASASVAGPGFVNVTLDTAAAGELARTIVTAGAAYGRIAQPDGSQRAETEFETETETETEFETEDRGPEFAPSVQVRALAAQIGGDAARFALLRAEPGSRASIDTPEIDLARWTSREPDNPLFVVQSAHARAHQSGEAAEAAGVRRDDAFVPELLDSTGDAALLAALGDYPRVLAASARRGESHRVAALLEEIAAEYHRWRDAHPVRPAGDAPITDAHRTRLWLNAAAGLVLGSGLGALGVGAPQRI